MKLIKYLLFGFIATNLYADPVILTDVLTNYPTKAELSIYITNVIVNNVEANISNKIAEVTLDSLFADEYGEVYSREKLKGFEFLPFNDNLSDKLINKFYRLNGNYFAIVYTNNNKILYKSIDGINWTVINFNNGSVNDIIYHDGLYLLGSSSGLYSSTNLVDWTLQKSYESVKIDKSIISIIYGNKFVAIFDDFGIKWPVYSDDGIYWEVGDRFDGTNGRLVYVNNIYYYLNEPTVLGNSYYSIDGISWSEIPGINSATYLIYSDKFILGSSSGLYYSVDGLNWTQSNITSGRVTGLVFDGNKYLATVGYGLYYSDDGITWIDSNIGAYNIEYNSGRYILSNPGSGVKYSLDGTNWIQSSLTNEVISSLYLDEYIALVSGSINNNTYGSFYSGVRFDSPLATKEYVDNHKWDYNTQIINAPINIVTYEPRSAINEINIPYFAVGYNSYIKTLISTDNIKIMDDDNAHDHYFGIDKDGLFYDYTINPSSPYISHCKGNLLPPTLSGTNTIVVTTNLTGKLSYNEIVGESNFITKPEIFNIISLSTNEESRGISFIDPDGNINQNVAITIGKDAEAGFNTNILNTLPDNTILRSAGIAIGAYSKATGSTSDGSRNQGIAIGFNANSAGLSSIAIGSGANHGSDTPLTGSGAYSAGDSSISIGYKSKSLADLSVSVGPQSIASNYWSLALGYLAYATATSSIAIGPNSKSSAHGAVQIGSGNNTEEFTLKFRDTTIVKDGKLVGTDVIINTNSTGSIIGYYLDGQSDKIFQPKGTYLTPNYSGDVSFTGKFSNGQSNTANGYASHVEGRYTSTGLNAGYAHAEGNYSQANGGYSHADGTYAKADDILSWVWQGGTSGNTPIPFYESNGPGTFNINPVGGIDGFYIGDKPLSYYISGTYSHSDESISGYSNLTNNLVTLSRDISIYDITPILTTNNNYVVELNSNNLNLSNDEAFNATLRIHVEQAGADIDYPLGRWKTTPVRTTESNELVEISVLILPDRSVELNTIWQGVLR